MARVQPQTKGPPARSMMSVGPHEPQHSKHRKSHKKFEFWPFFNVFRRVLVIAAAIRYIQVSLSASYFAYIVLMATPNPTETLKVFSSPLIADYMGTGLINNSPLVQNVLAGDSTPRDFAIYLESGTKTSTTNCSDTPLFNPEIYNNTFLGLAYDEMVRGIQNSNISTLSNLEPVAVVVDCGFSQLVKGDPSGVRAYNLVRSRDDPSDLSLVMMSLNVQNYEIHDHKRRGPGALATMNIVKDMSKGVAEQFYLMALRYPYQRDMEFELYESVGITDHNLLELRSIIADTSDQPVKNLVVGRERGFYNGQEQANVRCMHTVQDTSDAKRTLTYWEWVGETVSFDSYAWAHGVHLVFALQTIYYIVVLILVTYQKGRSGKLWVGDPFASMSTATLVMRGALVVISMAVNSFWMINEYALSFSAAATGTQNIQIHQQMLHADIQDVYLGVVGLLSAVLRERIDPSVAIALFEIIHSHRLAIVKSSPAVLNEIVTYSNAQYFQGVVDVTSTIANMTPLRFWTTYQLPPRNAKFLIVSFFPKAVLLAIVAGYTILHKIYRSYYPDKSQQRNHPTSISNSSSSETSTPTDIVTRFEISTGAELQTRFGLISDYSNYVYFKGMKFASADGVYCSGYVIVNGKLLVSTKDLPVIAFMKILRVRFKNVYAYEVDGYSVKETARLVFPGTLTWSDLWRLNVTVLL